MINSNTNIDFIFNIYKNIYTEELKEEKRKKEKFVIIVLL